MFIMSQIAYLLSIALFLTSTTITKAKYKHNVVCNPNNCSLSTALSSLRNDTRLKLLRGNYMLDEDIKLSHFSNILITGTKGVSIECSSDNIGLSIMRSQAIRFEHLAISKCGSRHIGTSLYNITYMAALDFVYCRDLHFFDVVLSNNPALAVNIFDVGGTVKFVKCNISNNSRQARGYIWGGGGIYVQFTYCGALYGNGCNQSDDQEHQLYIHNSDYLFQDCIFNNNTSPGPPNIPGTKNTDFLPPQGRDHMSFGRGGGLSFYLRSNASNNQFKIDGCQFNNNYAIWGGGLFTEIVDSCFHNTFTITGCNFTGNTAKWAGGGLRYGLIQVFDHIMPFNNGSFMNSTFVKNKAMWGGGASVYSTEETLTIKGKASSQIFFKGVTFIKNYASNGAAVGGASWKIIMAGGVVIPVFHNTTFKENLIVDYKISSANNTFYSSVIKGQGTICTNAMPFYFDGDNFFMDNVGSVFLLTDAVLTVAGSMEFHRNKGHDGGAISLLGQSWININPGSNFLFSKNKALRGAAIFVNTPGTPNRVASKNCFITYNAATTLQTLVSPDKWKTFFNFSHNNASVAGHSIYCSTLKYCSWYMEVYGFQGNQMFNWSNFVYENSSPMISEIATDPVEIVLNKDDWQNIAPSDETNPTVKLVDERGQTLPGVVFVGVQNSNYSNTHVDVGSGPYFPSDTKIYSLKMSGKSETQFDIDIQTTTGRAIKAQITNIKFRECRPGYYLKDNTRCACLKSPETSRKSDGITRCQGDHHVFIKKGLWSGVVNGTTINTFVTLPCPSMYCDFRCPIGVSCAPHEYLFLQEAHRQCQGHRTGVLCGKCLPGYSVVLGSDHCHACPDNYNWIGYFVLFLIVGAAVVVLVLLLNVDISSGYYTGSLFFYQVVFLLVRDGFVPDPVLRFMMGISNAQVGIGACMWHGMTDLQKLAFTYVLPSYILFLCLVVVGISRMPQSWFSRRSALRAFTTLFLVSYTTFTSVSLDILHFSPLNGKKVLFRSGEVEYFGPEHTGYGILAIIICAVIVIPFPLCLLLVQPLSYIKPGLGGGTIKPFLDIFQGCYKIEYRWFAGVYYLARIILLLIYTFISDSAIKHGLLCLVCISLLTLQSNIRPYKPHLQGQLKGNSDPCGQTNPSHEQDPNKQVKCRTWLNLLDSLLLMNLSVISLLGSFSTNDSSWFTPLSSSSDKSPADIFCLILMWLPGPYFIGIIVLKLYYSAQKRYRRAQSLILSRQESVYTQTSEFPSQSQFE